MAVVQIRSSPCLTCLPAENRGRKVVAMLQTLLVLYIPVTRLVLQQLVYIYLHYLAIMVTLPKQLGFATLVIKDCDIPIGLGMHAITNRSTDILTLDVKNPFSFCFCSKCALNRVLMTQF